MEMMMLIFITNSPLCGYDLVEPFDFLLKIFVCISHLPIFFLSMNFLLLHIVGLVVNKTWKLSLSHDKFHLTS